MEANNMAAMREALVQIRDRVLTGGFDGISPSDIVNVCDAAIAKPPRNCDIYITVEDTWDAYDEWVESYRNKGKTPPLNEFGWLLAPAAERKGDGDGK